MLYQFSCMAVNGGQFYQKWKRILEDVLLQNDAKNNMDKACDKQGDLQKNRAKKDS